MTLLCMDPSVTAASPVRGLLEVVKSPGMLFIALRRKIVGFYKARERGCAVVLYCQGYFLEALFSISPLVWTSSELELLGQLIYTLWNSFSRTRAN